MNPVAYLQKQNPLMLAGAALLLIAGVYYFGKKAIGDVAGVAGGIVSGKNAITKGTVYEGTGVAGTIGAAANAASGGVLETTGEAIGGWIFDVFGPKYDPNEK